MMMLAREASLPVDHLCYPGKLRLLRRQLVFTSNNFHLVMSHMNIATCEMALIMDQMALLMG